MERRRQVLIKYGHIEMDGGGKGPPPASTTPPLMTTPSLTHSLSQSSTKRTIYIFGHRKLITCLFILIRFCQVDLLGQRVCVCMSGDPLSNPIQSHSMLQKINVVRCFPKYRNEGAADRTPTLIASKTIEINLEGLWTHIEGVVRTT